jgi:hypothetical protein
MSAGLALVVVQVYLLERQKLEEAGIMATAGGGHASLSARLCRQRSTEFTGKAFGGSHRPPKASDTLFQQL